MTDLARAVSLPDDPIEWFHRNLELLLEDKKLGDRIETYFDTEDLAAVILGMYYFDQEARKNVRTAGTYRFDWKLFRSDDRVLVHCLAYAGWLGEVKLLPPHLVEFLSLLGRNFDIADVTDKHSRLAYRLLHEGLDQGQLMPDSTETISLEQLEKLKGPELLAAVGGKAKLAKEIFKLLQCVKGTWRLRFVAWQEQGVFQDGDLFDPVPYLQEEIFLKVRNALDRDRRKISINNFSDALAVAILAGRVRAFNQGIPGAKLPLFFNHSGELREAIERAGIKHELEYRPSKSKSLSILRDWHYFYFKATFGSETFSVEALQELLRQTDQLRAGKAKTRYEALAAIGDAADIKIGEQIKHMQEFRFFDTWLESTKDVQWVLQSLKENELLNEHLRDKVDELQSPEVKGKFAEAKTTVSHTYQTSVGTYQSAIKLLASIEKRIKTIHRWKRGTASPSDMMLVLGLIRFPFPEDVYLQIEETLGALVGAGARRMKAHSNVVEALYRTSSENPLTAHDLPFIFGMFWATELDSEIATLADRWKDRESADPLHGKYGEAPWFVLVWASALLREFEDKRHTQTQATGASNDLQKRQLDLIQKGFQLLEAQKAAAEEIDRARMAIGIAYLNFHFFLALRSPKLAVPLPSEFQEEDRSLGLLSRAVDEADQAWRVRGLDERRRIYALNQLLYYLAHAVLEGFWAFELVQKRLDEAADQLLTFEKRTSWHYRYDDSLARYYETVGRSRNDRGAWEKGKARIDRALESCFGDPLIQGYHRVFTMHYENWMRDNPDLPSRSF